MCEYESNSKMYDNLTEIQKMFPKIAKVGSIGESVLGKPLYYIKLSNNVNQRSLLEPMFKYVANMHGNEAVGRQMLIYLAKYLALNYGKDARITRLLNNTEIYLLPTLNPDGYETSRVECGANRLGRTTANGLDLNKDFPQRFELNSTSGREPETTAAMQWIQNNPFVLSGDLHSGYMDAVYPFDGELGDGREKRYSATPDDDTFRYLALAYANNHRIMHQNILCREQQKWQNVHLINGTINGAFLGDNFGSMKDYNYLASNCLEVYFAISCCKHPPVSHLPRYWLDNKNALLTFMEKTHMGVKGLVKDLRGSPVSEARVIVDSINRTMVTTSRGEYWRLLSPGNYKLMAESKDGTSRSRKKSVTVTDVGKVQIVNFVLKSKH